MQSYSKYIGSIYAHIVECMNDKRWKDDDTLLDIFDDYYYVIRSHIHDYLVEINTKNSEKEIRDVIAKFVIGLDDKKSMRFWGALEILDKKLAEIDKKLSKFKKVTVSQKTEIKKYFEIKERYEELRDNFMALASFRSMKHYFIYMQDVFGFTLWEDTLNCFGGYFFYGGRMVLDGDIRFIEKQCPTGYGKSASDCFMMSFIFGIDIDNDILKVCGNDKFTDDCFTGVVKLMTSHKYAKVFPYYAKFNCNIDEMFQFCGRKDLKFSIKGSKKSTNLRIVTKLSDVNGVRAKFLFLDDITQRKDMSNLHQHNKDIHSFTHEWFERNYNRNHFYIVASGTTYSQFDLLSHLKKVMGGDKKVKSPINKYTYLGKSSYIVPNGISVFVCVPLLDKETDESTYPKKISTESARLKRENNPVEFWAMDMQEPMPPDDSPFYFTKLREYTTLPSVGENGRSDTCVAALDTKRRGKDFVSMPILFEANDNERQNQTAFFLVDWFYDDRTMKECIPLIVSKIIEKKITRLYVERNTEECIEMILREKLAEKGYNSCIIEEVYSTVPKDRRIMEAEGDIKARVIFPQFGMYSISNPIGMAMQNVYGYTYKGKVEHDDAPDSLALFAKRFIMQNTKRLAEMSIFAR